MSASTTGNQRISNVKKKSTTSTEEQETWPSYSSNKGQSWDSSKQPSVQAKQGPQPGSGSGKQPATKTDKSGPPPSFAEQLVEASRSREFPDLYVLQNVEYGNLQLKGLVPKSRPAAKAFDEDVEQLSAVFRGQYKEGLKNGHGEAVLEDGSLISAEFVDGKVEGAATIVTPNGYSFNGYVSESKDEFRGSAFAPKRKATSPQHAYKGFASIQKHENQTYQPIKAGFGIAIGDDGTIYIGGFLNGLKHGYGTERAPEKTSRGTIYKGYWKEDEKDGEGILYDLKGVKNIYQKYEKGMLLTERRLY